MINIMNQSILSIAPKSAKIKNSEESDLLVSITLGDQTKTTKVYHDETTNPTWNDVFEFNLSGQNFITLTLYSGGHKQDHIIASSVFPLESLISSPHLKEWVSLSMNGAPEAEIFLEMELFNHKHDQEGQDDDPLSVLNTYGQKNSEFYGKHVAYAGVPMYSHAASPPMKNHLGNFDAELHHDMIVSEYPTVSEHSPQDELGHRSRYSSGEDLEISDPFEMAPDVWGADEENKGYFDCPNLPPSYTVPYNPYAPIV
eukprot:CAMPEP_0205823192 /NCGR_PEP_ID=MMETSP0206-20130828/15509_1 /ASSEMBLY_ACC=CAM_ASM_000279 /TAXON_ID=36767 /ORGANISM="Euplotes focardii, Strain TN1" /LENGTH=255 /DNA_ID=CAMNT_0053120143 /DNA_START=13 /DNA_END=780 /DNA_ORIENTATION=+